MFDPDVVVEWLETLEGQMADLGEEAGVYRCQYGVLRWPGEDHLSTCRDCLNDWTYNEGEYE